MQMNKLASEAGSAAWAFSTAFKLAVEGKKGVRLGRVAGVWVVSHE